jgi:penicillin-binding protein 1A
MNGNTSNSHEEETEVHGVRRSYLQSAIGVGLIVVLFMVVALVVYMFEIGTGLPSLEDLENPRPDLSTRIYSADGIQLDQFFAHNRTYIPYDSIPKPFIKALIATEDQKFYDHWGVNIERILKAVVKNVMAMNLTKEGASTITQQLARNLYLSQEVSLNRKVREQLTAVQIERAYTKNEILEMYANTVYFGRGAYGIQVAAEIFFGKRPLDLTVDECAYLVGVLKGPENYDAEAHQDRAIERRNTVLALMGEMGYLGGSYSELSRKPIVLVKRKRVPNVASHFIEAVRQTLSKEPKLQGYNLYRDGLVIYTTLDSRMQKYANQAVRDHLESFQPTFNRTWSWRGKEKLLKSIVQRAARESEEYQAAVTEAEKTFVIDRLTKDTAFIDSVKKEATSIESGFVVLEPNTGYIRAMVGGNDITSGRGLNHVTQIRRQPGSAFKPFVYSSAMMEGLNPGSVVSSASFSYKLPSGEVWSPKGSGRGGSMPLRSALKYSINTVAARLIVQYTTPAKVIKLAKEMGVKSPIPEYPSIALGSAEVTPLELTAAYGTFPNDGVFVEPTMILKVEDRWGHVIYQAPRVIHDALPPKIASEMVDMMRGVVDGGTATSIRQWFNYPAAGKTGTTQDFADAWFVGYTPQLVAGVWVGFDDHRIKFTGWYGQGGKAAAPVWGRFMEMVYKDDRLPYTEHNFSGESGKSYSTVSYRSLDQTRMENSNPSSNVLAIEPDGALENGAEPPPDKPKSPMELEGKGDALAPSEPKYNGDDGKK